MKNLCVYCSSSSLLHESYYESARRVGKLMAKNELTLVYGAGIVGIMGEVAKSVHENKGRVIGVIPEALNLDDVAYRNCDEFIITKTMRERKSIMEERADGFLCLPGGFGTLEEILEIITLKQLGYHSKPAVILNKNGFFDGLIAQFEKGFDEHFAKEENRKLYFVTDDEDEAFRYLLSYRPETNSSKWL